MPHLLDAPRPSAYNPHHSEVVRASFPDREGCERWKHPQENGAEVVWIDLPKKIGNYQLRITNR